MARLTRPPCPLSLPSAADHDKPYCTPKFLHLTPAGHRRACRGRHRARWLRCAQNTAGNLRSVNAVEMAPDARVMVKGADVVAYFTEGVYLQG